MCRYMIIINSNVSMLKQPLPNRFNLRSNVLEEEEELNEKAPPPPSLLPDI